MSKRWCASASASASRSRPARSSGRRRIRQFVEDWTLEHLLRLTEEAVGFAVKHGLPVMYVTEDTTRAHPETRAPALYRPRFAPARSRICVCDTVGHATPIGVRNLMHHIQTLVAEVNPAVKIDWHGHSDRGLGIPNTMMAIAGGVDRVHATRARASASAAATRRWIY